MTLSTKSAKRPTILDVAQRAGVSKSLVSMVMRDSTQVSEERRQAVLRAAEELGYRPNAAARNLARQRSFVIGVMLSDLRNPFFTELVDGIEAAAMAAGYQALANSGGRAPDREARALDALLQLRTDGLIIAGSVLSEEVLAAAAKEAPMVSVTRAVRSGRIDTVVNDDVRGAKLAVDHLVELGHTRIAHIDGGLGARAAERRSGFILAMKNRDLEPVVVEGDYTDAGGSRGATELLAAPMLPTAVFVANDLAAIGALHVFEEAGLGVPDDISLVGYDNTWLARLDHISLTTIDQPRRAMGVTAVELLIDRINGGHLRARHVVMQPELVVGKTTAPPPPNSLLARKNALRRA